MTKPLAIIGTPSSAGAYAPGQELAPTALRSAGLPARLGLIYFDLHADLNTPGSVPDGALDWMGVAHLLDEPDALPALRQIGPHTPLLTPEQVVVFGHSYGHATPQEREVIARRNVRTTSWEEATIAPEAAARSALALLPDVDRLLVHFDVDVIDFVDAPLSENTGRNEGLTLDQALRALRVFTAHPAFAALTITELNPLHGEEDGATLERFVAGLVEALR